GRHDAVSLAATLTPEFGCIMAHKEQPAGDGSQKQKSMAKVETLRPRDFSRILRAVPQLVQLAKKPLWIDYDNEADVLYLSFRQPQRATDSDLRDDGIIVHRRKNEIVGLTILDASTRP